MLDDDLQVPKTVPLLDLAPYHASLRDEAAAAFLRVYDSGCFILGPELRAFESELAAHLGVPHVVGVSSGTDALCAALLALDVGPGCSVVTTPFTFFATASAIRATGARTRFADIEANGFGLDPAAVSSALGADSRAVIGVHLFGSACAVEELASLCQARGVGLVEDAAQAIGASVRGRALGGFGGVGCFSFFPSKSLGALGDGGAAVTHDAELAARLRRIRAHGSEKKHQHVEFGGNFRLDEVQAAILRRKLCDLERRIAASRRHAAAYDAAFADLPGLIPPQSVAGGSYSLYTVRVLEGRDELLAALSRAGIEARVHYPIPLHLQPAFRELGYASGDFPNAERRSKEALSLPIYPELSELQRDRVVERVRASCR